VQRTLCELSDKYLLKLYLIALKSHLFLDIFTVHELINGIGKNQPINIQIRREIKLKIWVLKKAWFFSAAYVTKTGAHIFTTV
jgi:hypothetical protein